MYAARPCTVTTGALEGKPRVCGERYVSQVIPMPDRKPPRWAAICGGCKIDRMLTRAPTLHR